MKKKILATVMAAVLTASFAAGCGSSSSDSGETAVSVSEAADAAEQDEKGTVIVGSKDFTESLVIAEVYALALEDHGYDVERVYSLANAVIRESIVSGDIDIYPEYTGTSLVGILGMDPIYDPDECYETVKKEYAEQLNLTYLDSTTVNDSQGLAMSKERAAELGITKISEAWAQAPELVFACQSEFLESASGYLPLVNTYGEADWNEIAEMQHTLAFTAVKSGDVDVFSVYTTEGNLAGDTYIVLEDDLHAYTPYYLAPVARPDMLEANPGVEALINQVSATFTTENVIAMNAAVDIDQEEYEDVAYDYYQTIKDSITE